MNAWNLLLAALHSTLIDELVERHPRPKPELGMPIKLPGRDSPNELQATPFFILAKMFDQSALCALGLDDEGQSRLKINSAELWMSQAPQLQIELARRNITPQFEPISKVFPKIKQTIWIPIGLGRGKCWLGLGV